MWLFLYLVAPGQQAWLACCPLVCLSIAAALLAQRCFIALHPSFAGMLIGAFRTSLQVVGLAAAALHPLYNATYIRGIQCNIYIYVVYNVIYIYIYMLSPC